MATISDFGLDWVGLGVAVVGGISLVATLKNDTRTLKTAMADMQKELKTLSQVVVTLAQHEGRMNLTDERMMAQGRRFDEYSRIQNERIVDLTKQVHDLTNAT